MGFGGTDQCQEGARTSTTPADIYFSNVGIAPNLGGQGNVQIDLRITNESEYRAWNTYHNGIKRQCADSCNVDVRCGDRAGYFGAINLLAPRHRTYVRVWNEHFTFVQLKYEFLRSDGQPLNIGRTYMTFCTLPAPAALLWHLRLAPAYHLLYTLASLRAWFDLIRVCRRLRRGHLRSANLVAGDRDDADGTAGGTRPACESNQLRAPPTCGVGRRDEPHRRR